MELLGRPNRSFSSNIHENFTILDKKVRFKSRAFLVLALLVCIILVITRWIFAVIGLIKAENEVLINESPSIPQPIWNLSTCTDKFNLTFPKFNLRQWEHWSFNFTLITWWIYESKFNTYICSKLYPSRKVKYI